MGKRHTPVEVIERLIGKPETLGPICGLSDKAAWNWRHASSTRDAGDLPSTRIQRALLDHARARGIPLSAEMLIYGAPAAEIEALTRPADSEAA